MARFIFSITRKMQRSRPNRSTRTIFSRSSLMLQVALARIYACRCWQTVTRISLTRRIASRASYVIGPKGILRQITTKDLFVGRPVDEALRLV